jgi:hypothetical protein
MTKRLALLVLITAVVLSLLAVSIAAAQGGSITNLSELNGDITDVPGAPEMAGTLSWGDNFDGYATGVSLHGLNGWKGWTNDPTFTAFSSDAQARSAPNSVDILGNADLVQEYGENAGFWVYRASQYIPAGMVGTSYYIMLNQYDDAGATNNWSVQVQFNSSTGLIVDDGVSGATQPYITDQWVDVCLEIDLAQDTQAFYYNGAVFYTGTWSGHVSGGGITAIGAVDLFANGATSVFYDDMYLSPGSPGDCASPSPAAAIAMTKTVGEDPAVCAVTDEISVLAGTDVTYCYTVQNTGGITLTYHTVDDDRLGNLLLDFPFSLPPGAGAFFTVTTNITETTINTADWSAYTSGVYASDSDTATVNVVEPSIVHTKTVGTDPTACAATDSITVDPGTDVTYCYMMENTGTVTVTYHTVTDTELGVLLGPDFVANVRPGALVWFTATANIAETTVNTSTWDIRDDQGGSVIASDSDTATVTVQFEPAIAMTKTVGTTPGVCATESNIEVEAGTVVYYCYTVANTGNVTLSLHDLDDDQLGSLLSGFAYDLAPGASVDTVAAGLTVSATITTETTNVGTWTAYIVGGPSVTDTSTAVVTIAEPTDVSLVGIGEAESGAALPLLLTAIVGLALAAVSWRRRTATG